MLLGHLVFLLAQSITANTPGVPASLSVMAVDGDQTYCVATLNKNTPQIALTCRRGGATMLTTTIIKSSGVLSSGDLLWLIVFDPANPKLVHFSVAANMRIGSEVLSSGIRSAGDILWK